MAKRAPDIADLADLLDRAEDEDLLNSRAIEIAERLEDELKQARARANISRSTELEEERKDFERVIADIRKRRRDGVLDRFLAHAHKRKVASSRKH